MKPRRSRREIETYKSLRPSLRPASARCCPPQAAPAGGPAWDVFQTTPTGDHPMVVWAVQSDAGIDETVVMPVGLRANSKYEVRSVDEGLLAIATGAELMTDGILVPASPRSAAHVLIFTILRDR